MDTLRLKPRLPVADEIENWDDDDDFLVDGDELSFRGSVTTTTSTNQGPSRRRDSNSSHVSLRSDLESWFGEEKQLHLPDDDEATTLDAIAAAEHAGIPLPKNIPSSALMGGTIKRLGGRKIKKIIQEDWENDLELPESSQGLKIKPKDESEFPESLRQVSAGSVQTSPTKLKTLPGITAGQFDRRSSTQSTTSALSAALNLDKFKDTDDDDFFGDGCDTIKVSKSRAGPEPVSLVTPPTPSKSASAGKMKDTDDDFENDFELPSDGKLRLSTRKDIPKTPSGGEDLDWGEGSLGTRYGGTRRDGRSNRSSSASALSPSVSSSITAESEDETFDGLVLPPGPVNFRERLQHRKKSKSPERIPEEPEPSPKKTAPAEADRQDFFDGLDIADGKVFDSGKLTLHRNIKIKESAPASPARPKTAISLTFTNKPSTQTRIPRLSHERAHSTQLEPVYESGGSTFAHRGRRSQSRMGHASQSSVTSLPTPTTTSPGRAFPPLTPQRREVGARSSFSSLRNEPSTTSAQLLKQKRSLPAVRALNTPAKPSTARTFERPPSRTDTNRPQSSLRPKTPVERQRAGMTDSPGTQSRRTHLPFLPAGASQSQSQHVASKTLRQFRRHDSDNAIDIRPFSRSFSRSGARSPSPQRYRVAADTWERLSKPKNKKHFGDGHELDGFDDLPTSREAETRYLKQPIVGTAKPAARPRGFQNILPDRTCTPAPPTPFTAKPTQTPRFARDTAASRIARETARAQRVPSSGPLAPVTAQREAQLATRGNVGLQSLLPQPTVRSKKRSKPPQQLKPHLIANLNSGKESKVVNGMFYNAETYRWEGNENALNAFDNAPASTPSTVSVPQHMVREKEVATPRPALITNISATKGVQVVGGMVFDPEHMCWLKLGAQGSAKSEAGDTMDGFNALDDDEDVFKDIPDLEDKSAADDKGDGRATDIKDDWLVGEEFDVGPEFVRRQREEEDRWRKKCEKWVGRGLRDREVWRWTIRDLVSQFDELTM
ncbi:cytokinesis regulator [Purpureocillium lilacinum]|uniref:Cytokinesis regulator n=1 Tax=Purpureocillium lilacinum TaxID=33203 RepID=A0A179GQD7_PURLI|nr:cytokinesis regulator [Purpureocillium lilacinum]GJN74375.1 hypothetical protein PLICBS_008466 [Purpureocillium lilacinum]